MENDRMSLANKIAALLVTMLAYSHSFSVPKVYKYDLFVDSRSNELELVTKRLTKGKLALEIRIALPRSISKEQFLDSAMIDSVEKFIENTTPFLYNDWCESHFERKDVRSFASKSFLDIKSIHLSKVDHTKEKPRFGKQITSGYSSPWEKYILDSLSQKDIMVSQGDSMIIGYDSLNIMAAKIISINQYGLFIQGYKEHASWKTFLLSYEDLSKIQASGTIDVIRATAVLPHQVDEYKKWESDIIAENCNDF